ncbi:MAG: type II toxin-antitoxin system VapC family toxin [Saprospiraceae bacterium]
MKESLIDTDILSYFLKGDESVARKFIEYYREYHYINISIISHFEIIRGLEYKQASKQLAEFSEFVDKNCEVINLSELSISHSARIYGDLRRTGKEVGSLDLLIAGIALERDLELITNNEKHYRDIKGLKMDNWKK